MGKGVRRCIAVLACVLLSGCAGEGGSSSGGGDCVSHYDNVVGAPTWPRLKDALLRHDELGRAASVRVQARGKDVSSPGDEHVVRVVEVLNRNGRRLGHFDVWRDDAGGWSAGTWSQCID